MIEKLKNIVLEDLWQKAWPWIVALSAPAIASFLGWADAIINCMYSFFSMEMSFATLLGSFFIVCSILIYSMCRQKISLREKEVLDFLRLSMDGKVNYPASLEFMRRKFLIKGYENSELTYLLAELEIKGYVSVVGSSSSKQWFSLTQKALSQLVKK